MLYIAHFRMLYKKPHPKEQIDGLGANGVGGCTRDVLCNQTEGGTGVRITIILKGLHTSEIFQVIMPQIINP